MNKGDSFMWAALLLEMAIVLMFVGVIGWIVLPRIGRKR